MAELIFCFNQFHIDVTFRSYLINCSKNFLKFSAIENFKLPNLKSPMHGSPDRDSVSSSLVARKRGRILYKIILKRMVNKV